MKAKQTRKKKIGNLPVIIQITEAIKSDGDGVIKLKKMMKEIKDKKLVAHTKEIKRVIQRTIAKSLDAKFLKPLKTSLADLEKITKFPQEELKYFFQDFFVELAFSK